MGEVPEIKDWAYDGPELETVYIEGSGPDFVVFIDKNSKNARVASIEGKARWIITRDDGTQYIARPAEAKQ